MEPVASLFAPRSIPFSVEMFPPKGSLTLDAARPWYSYNKASGHL